MTVRILFDFGDIAHESVKVRLENTGIFELQETAVLDLLDQPQCRILGLCEVMRVRGRHLCILARQRMPESLEETLVEQLIRAAFDG